MDIFLTILFSSIVFALFFFGGHLTYNWIMNHNYTFDNDILEFLITLPTVVKKREFKVIIYCCWPYFWLLFLINKIFLGSDTR